MKTNPFLSMGFLCRACLPTGYVLAILLAFALPVSADQDHHAQRTQTLVVGSEEDYPPFAIGNTPETADGFTVELWKAVAEESDIHYRIRVGPFHQILQEFKDGKIDVLMNLAHSDQRHQFADFSVPHVVVNGAIFARKGFSKIHSEDDLAGKSIIVLKADIADEYAVSKGWGKQLIRVDTAEDGLELLASGKHDAMLLSKLVGAQVVGKLQLKNIEMLNVKTGMSQKFAFAVPVGKTELLARINAGLALTKASGDYGKLYEKWFGVYEEETLAHSLLKFLVPIAIILFANISFVLYKRRTERRQFELEKQQALDRIEKIASQLPGVIFQYRQKPDGSSSVPYSSDALYDIYRLHPEQVREDASPIFKLIHPEDLDGLIASINESAENLTPWNHEYRVKFEDGSIRWLLGNALPQREADNSVVFHGFITDITQRKEEEAKRYESEAHLRTLVQTIPDLIWLKNAEGVFLACNEIFERRLGAKQKDILGKTIHDFVPKELADTYHEKDLEVLSTGKISIQEEWITFADDGHRALVETIKTPMRNADGEPIGVLGIARDITSARHAQEELRQKERYQRALLDNFPFVVWLKDTQSRFLAVNQKLAKTFGAASADELVGKTDFDISTADLAEKYRADDRKVLESRLQRTVEEEIIDQGVRKWFETYKAPVVDENGELLGTVGFARDISDRRLLEAEFRIAATAFESQEGMLVTDAENRILRVNQAFADITGYSTKEALGQTPSSLLKSGRHDRAFYEAMWESIRTTGGWRGEIWNRRKNGEIHPVWLTVTAVNMEDGSITHYVATYTDITMRKASEEEIKNLAFYDSLTQLPNRRLMMDRLQQALASGARSKRQLALLFIDLDNFKTLNDTLGHDIGDMLLRQVANRLITCVRKGDTAARLGGDEFVVILEGLSENIQEAVTQAEIAGEKILNALNQPYQIAGNDYRSTPSIGVTLSSDHRETVDELLKRADIAMYQAKAAGRNTIRFFDPEMQAVVTARVLLEKDLRKALAENQFQLYFQTQVYHNRLIIGAEVLLRWMHPERGLVPPVKFIPLAEETGLILPIGRWVLETACKQLKTWEKDLPTRHLQLAVNVSPRQFHQVDFVKQIEEIISRNGINPDRLELELTESLVLDDIAETIVKMQALKDIGVHFSMDDFGTGYSSLAYLTQLPLDKLKIDQSFVHNIGVKTSDAIIVQTIIGMANNLGMEVIAEGVETEEQRAFLEKHGCPVCQGFLFSQPVPLEDFEHVLR